MASDRDIHWRLRKAGPDLWEGEIIFGSAASGAKMSVKALGPTQQTALAKAGGLAEQVIANPLVSAILPPQATLAIKAASMIGKSAAAGEAAKALGKFAGPGVNRLMKALF